MELSMVVFLVSFFVILESTRSQWICFLMGPLMDLVMDRGGSGVGWKVMEGPMDFQWKFQ